MADKIRPRAIDDYYIATAIITYNTIVAGDKLLARNAEEVGIEAYYSLEECGIAVRKMKELKKLR